MLSGMHDSWASDTVYIFSPVSGNNVWARLSSWLELIAENEKDRKD